MPPKRRLPIHQKDAREIAETPGPEPSSSPTAPPAQKAKREEERPVSLRDAPGNLRWDDDDLNGNIAGIASIAFVAVSMLETLSAGSAAPADVEEARKMVQFLGGTKAMNTFRTKVQENVGSFGPEPTMFRHFFEDKAWEANPTATDADLADGEEPIPEGGREASVELGTTPAPVETAGSPEGAAGEETAATARAVSIPDDTSSSDEPVDSSDEPLAAKRARAAEKAAEKAGMTSKYFGAGSGGKA